MTTALPLIAPTLAIRDEKLFFIVSRSGRMPSLQWAIYWPDGIHVRQFLRQILTEEKTTMISSFKNALHAVVLALLSLCTAGFSSAQITGQVQVTMTHPFIVANTTLPPGKYDFRMLPESDLTAMTVTSTDGNTAIEFLVRPSEANHVPKHTELLLNRYGSEEFVTRIYERGNRYGVAVAEPSRKELRLEKTGQHPVEHTESQQ